MSGEPAGQLPAAVRAQTRREEIEAWARTLCRVLVLAALAIFAWRYAVAGPLPQELPVPW